MELSALSFDTAWGRSAISRGVYLAAEPVKEPKLVPTLSHPVGGGGWPGTAGSLGREDFIRCGR